MVALQAVQCVRRLSRVARIAIRHRARQGLTPMKRIVVLNPKGGSGKTTLAINLASYYASRQQKPVLMDFDPQGSSVRWAKKRQPAQPPIHVIAACDAGASR